MTNLYTISLRRGRFFGGALSRCMAHACTHPLSADVNPGNGQAAREGEVVAGRGFGRGKRRGTGKAEED